jgi:hypothetical protein
MNGCLRILLILFVLTAGMAPPFPPGARGLKGGSRGSEAAGDVQESRMVTIQSGVEGGYYGGKAEEADFY